MSVYYVLRFLIDPPSKYVKTEEKPSAKHRHIPPARLAAGGLKNEVAQELSKFQ